MTLHRASLSRSLVSVSRRLYATTVSPGLTLGIRREDSSRIWERRCPLTPDAVHELVYRDKVNVLVQSCERRVFPAEEFVKAGAEVRENLSSAHIILGIKEVPIPELITSSIPLRESSCVAQRVARTHLMFSHTTKGQPYNMPLLSRFLQLGTNEPHDLLPQLIDYELLTDGAGKRTVGFGWFAGVAGTLESFSAMAHSHLELGVASPFLYTPRPHTHPSLTFLRAGLRSIGERIANEGTPKSLGPFVIGLTGTGKVAEGVLSILEELPIVNVKVHELPALLDNPDTDLHKIYLVHALPSDYLTGIDDRIYDRSDYYANPSAYKSDFCTKVAPYLTLFLNGTGWSPSFPRLMSNEQLAIALARAQLIGRDRFINIGDISCDIEGGLEFLTRPSTLSSPFYRTRPTGLPAHLPSVQMMSVDILPASIPLDSSRHFSNVLLPYLRALVHQYRGERIDSDRSEALDRATVARNGGLTEKHRWLAESVTAWRESAGLLPSCPWRPALGTTSGSMSWGTASGSSGHRKKRVLMLGSGMVAKPAVDEICKRSDVELLVASNLLVEADNLSTPHENARSLLIDVTRTEKVDKVIGEADVVISLLPVPFHPAIAELCIKHHTHLVTASYISPAMQALHHKACAADVLLLNEIGLDPGIDHCSAVSLISKIQAEGKRITSFISFCGGLPSPDCADVPLAYKFSWSPRGVLNAALNGANFKLAEKEWEIPGDHILRHYFPDVPISNILKFEGIANRDSRPYAKTYQLGPVEDIRTLLRGTLRYPGFSDLMHSFKSIGLLESVSRITPSTWSSLPRLAMETRLGMAIKEDKTSIHSAAKDLVHARELAPLFQALEWLVSETPSRNMPSLPSQPTAPIDLFTTLLAHKLRYEPNERDMVVLHHEIVAQCMGSGTTTPTTVGQTSEEVYTSSLIVHGNHEGSAMSRCVGLPVAFATLQLLDGRVGVRGVAGPADESVYVNVLRGLEDAGLGMKDTVKRGRGMEAVLAAALEGH